MQFTILGSHPNISLAEILAITGKKSERHTDKVALFENLETELTNLQKILGGIQKIGYIVGSVQYGDKDGLVDLCTSILMDRVSEKKIKFGFSVYEIRNEKGAQQLRSTIQPIGLTMKNALKALGRSARLVTSKEPILSSVVVTKNKLLQSGAEFVLIATKEEILVGVTEAVQDFEDWSHRDFDRPARDAKRGMLPPKLARIMINLAGPVKENFVLLDPFCGSGTVLMEASLLNYRKLLGSDSSKFAIEDTEQNNNWLIDQGFKMEELTLVESKAENLLTHFSEESVDIIVTEPFLGSPRQGYETKEDVESSIRELTELYVRSFKTLFQILKSGGTLVVASPVHMIKDKEFPVPSGEILKKIGFSADHPYEHRLFYRQKDQFVGRELLRFKKP